MFGLAVGGSDSSFSARERSTSGSMYGAHVGVCAAARFNDFYLSGSIGYGRFDVSTSRFIAATGLPTEQATGRCASDQFKTIGTPAAKDAAQVTAGGSVKLSESIALYGNFTGEFAKKSQTCSGLGGLRLNW